jgi:hypothetical protein
MWHCKDFINRQDTFCCPASPCQLPSLYCIGKVKSFLCLINYALRHEVVWGRGCINPHFLDLGTSWRGVVNFTLRPLYPRGKSAQHPLDRRLGGPQSWSGQRGENSCPYRDSNYDPSIVQPVSSRYIDCAIPTSVSYTLEIINMTNIHGDASIHFRLRQFQDSQWCYGRVDGALSRAVIEP